MHVDIYTQTSSKAGKHARDSPGHSHLSSVLSLCTCQIEGLFTAKGSTLMNSSK